MTETTAPAPPPMRFALPDGRDLTINVPDAAALMAMVATRLETGQGFSIATLNLDHLVKLRRSAPFRDAYLATDFVVADGKPVVWLSHLARRPVRLAPGSELIDPLVSMAAAKDVPIALYGTSPAALDKAAARLEAAYPGLRVIWRKSPPLGFEPTSPEALADAAAMAASGARLCFLALGAPKQEIFAVTARAVAPACGFVSIGAGIDFIAGTQVRAPVWVRRLALEWVWRMLGNPRRLAGRYAACALLLPRLATDALRDRGMPMDTPVG